MRIPGQRGRLTAEHLMLMQVPPRYWQVSFDEIWPGARAVFSAYLRNLNDRLDKGMGMLLWGTNGTGKTAAAAFIAKEVRRTGASVLMITAHSIVDASFEKTMDEGGLLIDRVRSVDFLVIDDLGKEDPARGRGSRLIENVLRERGAHKRTTWITTNMSPGQELIGRYGASLVEVMKELVVPIRFHGESRRDAIQDRMRADIGLPKEAATG